MEPSPIKDAAVRVEDAKAEYLRVVSGYGPLSEQARSASEAIAQARTDLDAVIKSQRAKAK